MKYNAILIVDNKKENIILELSNNKLYLYQEENKKEISINDIVAIKKEDTNILDIMFRSFQIITIIINEVDIIINNLNNFNNYNNTNIMLNNSIKIYSKKARNYFIITVIFMIVYNGFIGITIADEWHVSAFGAFIGNVLGGGSDIYPKDHIQILILILLIIETIFLIKSKTQFTNKYIYLLDSYKINNQPVQIKNKKIVDNNNDYYKELEKLKELLDKNIITQNDYDNKKEEILKKI